MGNTIRSKQQAVVLFLTLCALVIPLVIIEWQVIRLTGGKLIYPLDDTYIHMAIAKNVALYNNWGISPHAFQSASSSVLYTVLLGALFKLFSVSTVIPFIVNLVAGIILIFVIQRRLQKENIGFIWQLFILLLVIFFTPLPILIISGMEHTIQCLLSFLFIFSFSAWAGSLDRTNPEQKPVPKSLFIYGMAICSVRYEGLFIIAIACCILLYYRKLAAAFLLGFISILPLIVFGVVSVGKESYFLPNSVLLKASPVEIAGAGFSGYVSDILIDKLTLAKTGITALATQRLLIILPLAYLLFRNQLKRKASYSLVILFIVICTLLQLCFAKTGWFYRYEAYLIMCSVVIVSILAVKYTDQLRWRENKALLPVFLLISFFLFFPLVLRSSSAYSKAAQACKNIYEQQCQMANFINKFYNADTIAVNDIGAVSFFNESTIIDLWGLADMDVAKAKKDNYDTPAFLNGIVARHKVEFAIVYDSWFDPVLLHQWKKVATWQIENNVICGDATVSFYAVKPGSDKILVRNLTTYQSLLPADVTVKYYNE
ncbi:hypothetical protein [Parafilimonas sp.]|uniref:hypothetical protein n=1 Tax=Parafilimonas sp. TaxID=1969739 RepID=UPI0039E6ABD7